MKRLTLLLLLPFIYSCCKDCKDPAPIDPSSAFYDPLLSTRWELETVSEYTIHIVIGFGHKFISFGNSPFFQT